MRNVKDLIGKPVISITDGRDLGDVKDLYFDHRVENIEAVYMGSKGLFRKKTFFFKRESVHVFGLDAILVKDSDVMLDSSQYAPAADWLRHKTLKGRTIDTPGGTKVGKVGNLIINEDARVIGVALSHSSVEGTIDERRSISRAAVLDMGEEDGIVTVDLKQAEQLELAPATEVVIEDFSNPVPSHEEIETLLETTESTMEEISEPEMNAGMGVDDTIHSVFADEEMDVPVETTEPTTVENTEPIIDTEVGFEDIADSIPDVEEFYTRLETAEETVTEAVEETITVAEVGFGEMSDTVSVDKADEAIDLLEETIDASEFTDMDEDD